MSRKKTAVILFNIGGPSGPETIEPYLRNFFSDPNIIGLPAFIRKPLARRIAAKRARGAAKAAYAPLGGKSPLLENTKTQERALEERLKKTAPDRDFRVFTAMRYWHPFSHEVLSEVMGFNADDVVLLPLYPQFSTATSYSSLTDWKEKARAAGFDAPMRVLCCYHDLPGFIAASARLIGEALATAPQKIRVLFSAHGLPEKTIRGGDPYQWQCERTAEKIAAAAALKDWQICYQSRVGPLKWIGPSTEEALKKAAGDGVGVVVYPHAFVSDHVETLVEIEIEYRHKAEELGVPFFARAPAVGAAPEFIEGLAALVLEETPQETLQNRVCPLNFKRCWREACGADRLAS